MGECAKCDFCINGIDGTLYCALHERLVDACGSCNDQQEVTYLIDGDTYVLGRTFGYEEEEYE